MSTSARIITALLALLVLVLGALVAVLLRDRSSDGPSAVMAEVVDGGTSSPSSPELVSTPSPSTPTPAAPASQTPTPGGLAAAFATTKDGVIRIETINCSGGNGRGSAFLVAPQLAVTNAHVVEGARRIAATVADGLDAVSGVVIAEDRSLDLALVRLEPTYDGHVFELADEDPSELQDVVAIGYPLGERLSGTRGVVSGLDREGLGLDVGLVQMDALINPGNSGGPVIDEEGRVVAVSVAGFVAIDVAGVNYAIPASAVGSRLKAWFEGQDMGVVDQVTCDGVEGGGIAGDTVVNDLVGSQMSAEVAETLQQYFDGINSGQYSITWSAMAPSFRDSTDFAGFTEGVSTSHDFAIVLQELRNAPDGQLIARVRFTSIQAPEFAPDGISECVDWQLDYPLVESPEGWLLERSEAVGERAWEPCG